MKSWNPQKQKICFKEARESDSGAASCSSLLGILLPSALFSLALSGCAPTFIGDLDRFSSSPATTVDQTPPRILDVTPPAGATYHASQTLSFQILFSEIVSVAPGPYLSLNIGGSFRQASYVSGSGTALLTFAYVVTPGEADLDGITLASPLMLGGGTIRDSAGNDADLVFTTPDTTTVLIQATQVSVTLSSSTAAVTNVSPIPITVTFSEDVTGFISTDVSLSGGSLSNFTPISGSIYTFDLTPAGEGVLTVDVSAGVAQGQYSNLNTGATQLARTYDSTPPAAAGSVAWQQTSPHNASAVTATWTPSNASDLSSQSIQYYSDATCTVATGSAIALASVTTSSSDFSGTDGNSYSFRILSFDAASNSSTSACSGGILIDTTAPTLAITSPAGGSYINAATVSSVTVSGTCSENGRNVALSGAASGTVACSSNLWSVNLDFTSATEGAVTLYADHSDAAGNPAPQESLSLNKDTVPPTLAISAPSSTLVLTSTGSVTFTVTYSGASTVNLSGSDISLNTSGGSSCTKTVTNGTTATPTVTLSGCSGAGGSIGISIAAATAQDAAGNPAGASSASSTVSVVDAPALALSDATTLSTSYIRQTSAAVSISNDSVAAQWCLSESQTTAPASGSATCTGGSGSADGWHTSKPSNFTFSSGDGAKTLHLWIADASGSVLGAPVSHSITLDSTPPATPTVELSNPDTTSTTNTNRAINTLSITSDTGATKWCVIETLSTDPAPDAPLFDNACFVSTRPVNHTLSGRGSRRVHVYTQDVAGNISTAAGTSTLDFPLPSVLTLTGPSTTPQASCSDPITLTAKDSYGLDSPSHVANAVTLSGQGAGSFYSDAGCTSVITQTLSQGESSRQIYFKSASLGSLTLDAAGFSTSAQLPISVESVYQISTGQLRTNGFTCAVVAGAVQCWGNNDYGQLGNGDGSYLRMQPVGVSLSGLSSGVSQVSTGTRFTCAVHDGAAKCWGDNWAGQLGIATYSNTSIPTQVLGLTSGVRKVSAGHAVACAVVGESARCWGSNDYGQLGAGSTGGSSNTPVQVNGLTSGVTEVAATSHSCAIQRGGLKCWGRNSYGQLGNNSRTSSDVPVDVLNMSSGVTAVAVVTETTCAIKEGIPYCWGSNHWGRTGDPATVWNDSLVPVAVAGISGGATAISIGTDHACALVNAGVKCWGGNTAGQIGTGAIGSYAPVGATAVSGLTSGVASVSAGGAASCAVLSNNQFRCWGSSAQGQIGDALPSPALVPVGVTGLGSTVTAISGVSAGQNCVVLSNGRIQCWGLGPNGELGDGNWVSSKSPVYVGSNILSGATSVSGGLEISCGVVDGKALCWGGPYGGEASQVPTLTSLVTNVSVSAFNWYRYSCAIMNGGVKCWGDDYDFVLGGNSGSHITTPVEIADLPAGSGATDIATGNTHACAVVGGAVKCWGSNSDGQLGNGSYVSSATPVTAVSSGATAVSAGAQYTCAIVSGAAMCWGANWWGRLGTGNYTDFSSPVQVSGLSSGVTSIAAGLYHTCASTSTGTVKCWGRASSGELGNGSSGATSTSPVNVTGITSGATQVSVGPQHSCALVNNTLKCWGRDEHGVLGDQPDIYSNALRTPILVGSPAKLTITGPATSTAGNCSTVFTVRLRDVSNILINAPSALTLNLKDYSTGTFHSTAGCGGAAVTSVSMPPATDTATFYYKAASAGEVGISVESANLIRTGIKHTAN